MPQVPYNPIPSVAPQDTPIPSERIDTPGAAFGTTIAAATQHLGDVTDQAASEVFQRGIAMQDLYNHSQALEGVTKLQKSVGDIHAKLSAMQGKDAVDYYTNGYIDDINKAKEDVRNTLPNPMAQKIYDQGAESVIGRTIFNGAGHAAIENKQYAIGAAGARVKESQNAALLNPQDDAGFQQHLQDTISNTQAQWQLQGADSDTIDAATHKAVSDLYVSRIEGLAKTHPFQADEILAKAAADGKIEGEDLGKITNLVQSATHTVGARNLSSEVRSGSDLSPGAGAVSIGAAKAAIGGFETGNNYQSLGVAVPGRGQALGKYQVMPENLGPWLKDAGLPPMTPAQFLASPSAQDKVFETKFSQFMTQTGSFNDAASMWFTGKPVAQAGNVKDANGTSVPSYLASTNRILAQNAPLADQVAKVRQRAGELAPDDPTMADFAEQRITADYHLNRQIEFDDQFHNRMSVETALVSGNQQGKLPTNPDELKAISPEVEAAWNNMRPDEQRKYMSIMATTSRQDVAMTDTRLKEYQRLKGEAQSDPAAFLDEDVVGADLPMSAKKELVNDQVKKKANAEADPRVTQALQVLRPTLDAAGISRTSDAQGYDQYVGALQGALEDFSTDNKRPPNAKEVGEIGQRLLQSVAGTGWLGSSVGGSKVYNVAVPDAERTKILSDPFWTERGITPTDDQVQRIYARQIYQKLYGGTTKADTPSVPTSK
jgi:hypothetical protein